MSAVAIEYLSAEALLASLVGDDTTGQRDTLLTYAQAYHGAVAA